MDFDAANREVNRLLRHYGTLPYAELVEMANGDTIESEIAAPDGLVTFTVLVRDITQDTVRVEVSAFGNNWWKLERIDESVIVARDDGRGR